MFVTEFLLLIQAQVFDEIKSVQFVSGGVHAHEALSVVGRQCLLVLLIGSDCDLDHPKILISAMVVHWYSLD
jgi:hypothetical protein